MYSLHHLGLRHHGLSCDRCRMLFFCFVALNGCLLKDSNYEKCVISVLVWTVVVHVVKLCVQKMSFRTCKLHKPKTAQQSWPMM